MKCLHLVYKDKSDIDYDLINYPDGQKDIIIKDWAHFLKDDNVVQIKTRINNFEDLGLLACAKAALQKLDIEVVHLYAPYILGARSDRQFVKGGTSYLVDVVAPIINSLNFKSVTVIDPHSDVLEACIKGFKKESNKELAHWAISDVLSKTINKDTNLAKWTIEQTKNPSYILVSPDAGASKKIYKLAEQIGYKGDIITCSKDRDENGKLTKCIVPIPFHKDYNSKDIIIIDDICDGGNTFINIAKEIKDVRKLEGKIYLIVTHGIFSKGFDELSQYFDGIYCTNSYKDFAIAGITKEGKTPLVKELNVF